VEIFGFMANLDKKTIKSLTQLSKIQCTEEEEESLLGDLKNILTYVEQLDEINTENIVACNHILETNENAWREDAIGPCLSREVFLSNTPSQVGGLVKVPTVIKQS
jgi:aspartyl-tRNA(Asn)/glutamyl-tRNA(Gln) amidotransferase subunit C